MEDPVNNEDEAAEGMDPRVILAGILGQSGPRGVHEGGVHGSVIEQTKNLLETYMKPEFAGIGAPDGTDVPAIISCDGIKIMDPSDFDAWRENPRFRTGTAMLLDLDSFIAHANRFKDDDSVIFADNNRNAPKIGVVYDYHHSRAKDVDAEPRGMRHKSTHLFPLSDQWKAWAQFDGQLMPMRKFAEFIEDHITDVMPVSQFRPSENQAQYVNLLGGMSRVAEPVKLMELSTGFQVYEQSEVASATKLASGETQLVFKSTHTDGQGGALSAPSMFALAIPVFVNDEPYQVLARFRYRKNGAELTLGYDLWRTDLVFDHAFTEALAKVADATKLPVLLGRPEA